MTGVVCDALSEGSGRAAAASMTVPQSMPAGAPGTWPAGKAGRG